MSKKIGFLQRWMFIINKINAHPYINKEKLISAVENEFSNYDGVDNIGINAEPSNAICVKYATRPTWTLASNTAGNEKDTTFPRTKNPCPSSTACSSSVPCFLLAT